MCVFVAFQNISAPRTADLEVHACPVSPKLIVAKTHSHFSAIGHARLRQKSGNAIFLYLLEPLAAGGVNAALVVVHVALPRKTRVAAIAHIRLLPGVQALMHFQVASSIEACITARKVAHIWLFIYMQALMLNQFAICTEASITPREITFERLLTRVTAHVNNQSALMRETCSTFLAYERLLASMRTHVDDQATSGMK